MAGGSARRRIQVLLREILRQSRLLASRHRPVIFSVNQSQFSKFKSAPALVVRSMILLWLLTCGCSARDREPLCAIAPAATPKSWRPSGNNQKNLSAAPWSADEAEDAAYAVRTGLNELGDFFS